MKKTRLGFLLLLATLATAQDGENSRGALRNIKQLTAGGENAEAYWSPDSQRLIFQSTRDNLKCDQIFIMNADGSDQHMVSTGKGRTTCGYFLPDNRHILYASTHLAGDACPPAADRSKGYVWAVYPSYDIFVAKEDGSDPKRLTSTPGYDAEATINWKTKKIVYTSLASGDLDLWTMDLSGGHQHQLTNSFGYDGGPVFSKDGKQVVWRGNHPTTADAKTKYSTLLRDGLTSPMKMELFISAADGKNPKQITSFGCASFAPTFTPDGKKILFSSNKQKCDSREFELFLINTDGTGLRQLTSFGGFTSFPEISPDGRKLVFVSTWKGKTNYEFNIFTADWSE